MKSYLLTAIVLFTCMQSEAADSLSSAWQKANQFFQQKQYDSAILYYESLADRNISNPELYYNLGNAYYKANKIGPAVLNYERALQINPDYTEARDNLTLTQSRIANRIQEPQDIFFVAWWKSMTKQSLAGSWSIISLALFLLTLLIVVLRNGTMLQPGCSRKSLFSASYYSSFRCSWPTYLHKGRCGMTRPS